MPRKFKIAVGASRHDRAALAHPRSRRCTCIATPTGEVGFEVMVGGGLGRTPFLAKTIKPFLPQARRAELCRGDSAHLQPVRPPRQYLQGAHQDSGARTRAPRPSPARSRPNGSSIKDGTLSARPGGGGRDRRRASAIRPMSASTTARRNWPRRAAANRRFDAWMGNAVANHKIARLCHRHTVAQAGGRHAGRCDRRADGRHRRSWRALFVRRNPRRPRTESRAAPCGAARPVRRCGARSMPSASPRRMSVSSPTSSPVRGSIIAASPMRARSRSRRK